AGFEMAERFWSKNSFSDVEVFFFVNSQDFRQKVLLHGVPDEWLIVHPFDSQELATRILRRVFNIKVGREQNNRSYLTPYLEILKKLAVPGGDPIVFAPFGKRRAPG